VLRLAGGVEGYEARFVLQRLKRGGLVIRAPNADLGRDPRWGRTEECYGEDPFFNGTMATGYVKGLQGDNPKYWMSASLLKHFLANSNEKNRMSSSSDFDEQLLHEYYGVPFRMAIEDGGARCFMASYNAVNKIPDTVQPVIKNVAMKMWGLDGIVSTDAGSLPALVRAHKAFPDEVQAAAAAVKAGINQFIDRYQTDLTSALSSNLLTEADITENVKGELRVFIRLGLVDPPEVVPYSKVGAAGEPDPWTTDKTKAIVKLETQESIVLLKNTGALLPLDKTKLKTIAVVGPRANEVDFDWYSAWPPYAITPLQGIQSKVGASVTINCVTNNTEQAVAAAKAADAAIVVVGNNPGGGWAKVSGPTEGRESIDREAINLEQSQETLIEQVTAANPKTIVVIISSYPYAINWAQEHVPAIVHMSQNSQELGSALADVLFGDYNPAGRLVQTWPKSLDQVPPMMDYNIRNGRTYMYFKGEPLYPFGFGLSYTTFKYSNLKASADSLSQGGAITVSVDVENSGKTAGEEVVQLYVKDIVPAAGPVPTSLLQVPAEQLKGFKRVALKAGERKTVEIPLSAKLVAHWDMIKHAFVLDPHQLELRVGASSADIRLTKTIAVK
jgi:beta-glucosidase